MRQAGAESMATRGGMSHEALPFGEKKPASGRKSLRSGDVRTEE